MRLDVSARFVQEETMKDRDRRRIGDNKEQHSLDSRGGKRMKNRHAMKAALYSNVTV